MIKELLQRFLREPALGQQAQERPRIHETEMPSAIYAIGDIHGSFKELRQLEAAIAADAAVISGEKWQVFLGDYIDRGPSSAMVLDHLLTPTLPGFRRVCLAGNHEHVAFDFLSKAHYGNGWLDLGGRETLASYGLYDPSPIPARLRRQLVSHIPDEHVQFLKSLPSMLTVPGYCFVHAGVDPKLSFDDQREHTLLWSRPWDFEWPVGGTGYRLIHGHTPTDNPDLTQERINIDLGTYATRRLGAIKLTRTGELDVIFAS